MFGIDRKVLSWPCKKQILTFVLQNCKKSAVKYFIEKLMLLNFGDLSTIFCPSLFMWVSMCKREYAHMVKLWFLSFLTPFVVRQPYISKNFLLFHVLVCRVLANDKGGRGLEKWESVTQRQGAYKDIILEATLFLNNP